MNRNHVDTTYYCYGKYYRTLRNEILFNTKTSDPQALTLNKEVQWPKATSQLARYLQLIFPKEWWRVGEKWLLFALLAPRAAFSSLWITIYFHFASPGLESDFLAVLNDYPSPDISPPIFRRGEKLRVLSEWVNCSNNFYISPPSYPAKGSSFLGWWFMRFYSSCLTPYGPWI